MTQKILAGRADDPNLKGDLVRFKVDQVVLSREPNRAFGEAIQAGMKKVNVEVAVAYDTRCITNGDPVETSPNAPSRVSTDVLQYGVLIARPGIGFPGPVHLERFASPARLAITDEPRLASVGGAAMLTLTASPSQLGEALAQGMVWLRPPRTVQVLLSGRIRPFVCIRDVALELIRRGLGELTRAIDDKYRAPVVIEFAGPSARLLSVPERAILCALAPGLGAAGAVFVSDEKTEVYLRDQRRSKAHRGLVPDPGAPCDDALSVDLSAVDPLVMDEEGVVRPVRDLVGRPVHQVILGGDCGASLRDLLAAAALLKSKRVPARLELLLAPPSRQALEVLSQSGALTDLIATGARLLEPDHRIMTGELYPAPAGGASMRTYDPEPGAAREGRFVVASAETIAYAVATGMVGDPRTFKRPVRVTVPRTLPTDDVLVVRKSKAKGKEAESGRPGLHESALAPVAWVNGTTLEVVPRRANLTVPSAMVFDRSEDVEWVARRAAALSPHLRAVIAPHIPSGTVPILAGLGILALSADPEAIERLRGEASLRLPAPDNWNGDGIPASLGSSEVTLRWLAVGAERDWTQAGTARAARQAKA